MQITETKGGYFVTFAYSPKMVNAIKAIPGARWNGSSWHIAGRYHELLADFERTYAKRPKFASEPEQLAEIPDLPELEMELDLKRPLFHYQSKGVAYGLRHKRFINGDDPGLGKTSTAIATVHAAGCKCVLVICPGTLKVNWQREFMTVSGTRSVILKPSIKKTWQQFHHVMGCKVFITNFESLKTFFVSDIKKRLDGSFTSADITLTEAASLFDCIIIDESHRVKESTTLQTKLCLALAQKKEYVMLLSGTPLVNLPRDLFAQLAILGRLKDFAPHIQDPPKGYAKRYFFERYCGGMSGKGNGNLRELYYKLSTICYFKRRKADVLQELPAKRRCLTYCDITTRKEYDEALNDLYSYLIEYWGKTAEDAAKSLRGEVMVRIQKCQNIAARGKLAEVFEKIDETLGGGEKYVLFFHQKAIGKAVMEQYPGSLMISGDVDNAERDRAMQTFQTDPEAKLILCSIKAAGVGLTLTAASRMGFVEFPWHSALLDQCEDRIHRIGQRESCLYDFFIGTDTVDEDVYEIIEAKRKVSEMATGNIDGAETVVVEKLANLFNERLKRP